MVSLKKRNGVSRSKQYFDLYKHFFRFMKAFAPFQFDI